MSAFLYAATRLFFGTLALAVTCFVLGVVARVVTYAVLLGWNLL